MKLLRALLLLCLVQCAHAQSLFSATQPVTFALPAGNFTVAPAFDLPAGVGRFRVEMTSTGGADVDLFMRFGDAFPAKNSFNLAASFEDLQDMAQFSSISAQGNESILVSDASARKPRAGRYFLGLFNGDNKPATITLRLVLNPPVTPTTFDVRFDLPCDTGEQNCTCDLAPWNDPSTTGFTSPGNSGTTLGQKRRNAVLAAVQQIANTLQNEQTTVIRACWDKIGVSDGGATLARTSADYALINDYTVPFKRNNLPILVTPSRQLPLAHTWYSPAAANRAAGTAGCATSGGDCATHHEMTITFNLSIDTPGEGLGSRRFHYGITPQTAGNNFDVISVTSHEILHGLGYVDLISKDGQELLGRDDMFTRNIILSNGNINNLSRLSDSARLQALTSNSIYWIGPQALSAASGTLQMEPGLQMYAPNPYKEGSTLSHLDNARFPTELMRANYANGDRSIGFAAAQLRDVGWANPLNADPAKPKFYPGNYYDVTRGGHGIDIQPIANLDGNSFNKLLMTFYTYDQNGDPEYYISTGPVVDSAFLPDTNRVGNSQTSLGRYFVRSGQITPDANFNGAMRMDFRDGGASAACTEPGRGDASNGATAIFILGNETMNWCMQPLVGQSLRASPDFSGHWFSPGDGGWGISIVNALVNGKVLLNALIYYPDAEGNPRWAFAQSNDFQSGQSVSIKQRKGYCRTCAFVEPVDTDIGQITIKLADAIGAVGGNNEVSFKLTFRGPAGGNFSRSNAKLVRLASAPRELD
jgi:hypothetical protein